MSQISQIYVAATLMGLTRSHIYKVVFTEKFLSVK